MKELEKAEPYYKEAEKQFSRLEKLMDELEDKEDKLANNWGLKNNSLHVIHSPKYVNSKEDASARK